MSLGVSVEAFPEIRLEEDRISRAPILPHPSRRVLPKLLKDIGPLGLFVHDSLHTKRNMAWEFATATPYLAPTAAVLSDDVESNHAFEDWARKTAARWALVRQVERPGWLGVAFPSRST